MRVVGVDAEGAMEILGRSFPRSAADGAKQRFLLKRLTAMRPSTLADACLRAQGGEPWDVAMGDFLQTFYAEPSPAARSAMLADEPPSFDDPRLDALIGGVAEDLSKRWAPDVAPPWIGAPSRYLRLPFFPDVGDDPGLMEYLTFASPAEFKSRNVMVDDEPLRRANRPRR